MALPEDQNLLDVSEKEREIYIYIFFFLGEGERGNPRRQARGRVGFFKEIPGRGVFQEWEGVSRRVVWSELGNLGGRCE